MFFCVLYSEINFCFLVHYGFQKSQCRPSPGVEKDMQNANTKKLEVQYSES